ncbi:MAG: class I SAM-dependent methyltransferase, partial [Bacillota bacterium]|nr:class I SAM-dependent methyltransferase [Bacillota bacterium]
MISLTPRLKQIANLVNPGEVLVDVGTDHAYIPIFLVQQELNPRAIATDIHDGPYKIARDKVRAHILEDKIEVRKGNGLIPIKPGEAKVAVIAGMGGLTIRQILTQSPHIVEGMEQLVLQPMMAAEEVRKWLAANKWHIAGEIMIKEEDRYYQIINAIKGEGHWPDLEDSLRWKLGPKLVAQGDKLLIQYIIKLIETDKKLISELEDFESDKSHKRVLELKEE